MGKCGGVQFPVLVQLESNLITEDVRSLEDGVVKLQNLKGVQRVVADKILERRVGGEVVFQVVQHFLFRKNTAPVIGRFVFF